MEDILVKKVLKIIGYDYRLYTPPPLQAIYHFFNKNIRQKIKTYSPQCVAKNIEIRTKIPTSRYSLIVCEKSLPSSFACPKPKRT